MSTQTQTLTQQVHLLNIITIAQDKLQTNFRSIVNRLKLHDKELANNQTQMKKMEKQIYKNMQENQQRNDNQIRFLTQQIQKCFGLISSLNNVTGQHDALLKKCSMDIQSTNKQIVDINNSIQQNFNQTNNLSQVLSQKFQKMQSNVYKLYEELLKKQDSTQVLKITKDIDVTKQKVSKNQKEYKMLQHKLEKIQILNQKTERNQTKKQIQLMKQIQDKIRKQMKNLQKSITIAAKPSRCSNFANMDSINTEVNQNSQEIITKEINLPERVRRQSFLSRQNRASIRESEDDIFSLSVKNSFQKLAISKMNDKLQLLETKVKSFENIINNYANQPRKQNKPESQQFKQKLNEIKPQLVKLWAKCDLFDDRIAFNQRKLQEKVKILNHLCDHQKQNTIGRLDEKFKVFQTQIYTNIKQLKSKVDTKVNTQDYEKQCLSIEQQLKQISEIVHQKSDKLQVKKALIFLQSKIKQIILVISQDEQVEKDALLTKKQLKCIACDKDIDKMNKFPSTGRENWNGLPNKEHSPQVLGKFGMTGFGSLAKKLKKLEAKDLPILKCRKNVNNSLQPIVNTTSENIPTVQSQIDQ